MSEARRPVTDADLRRFTGYGMKRAFNAIQADLNGALAPHGIRMLTYSALSVTGENPGISAAALAGALSMERSNMVGIVDELVRAGWIDRARAQGDRRSYALRLTDAGRAALASATIAVEAHEARMVQGLSGPDRAALRRAFALIEGRMPR